MCYIIAKLYISVVMKHHFNTSIPRNSVFIVLLNIFFHFFLIWCFETYMIRLYF